MVISRRLTLPVTRAPIARRLGRRIVPQVAFLRRPRASARRRSAIRRTSVFEADQRRARFARMVAALGGPADLVDDPDRYLPAAPIVRAVHPDTPGIVQAVNGRRFGNAIIELGGGRRKVDDELDLSVGFVDVAAVGSHVGPDRPLAVIHAANEASAEIAGRMLREAYTVGDAAPAGRPVVLRTLTP